jgi:hypothetical protein
VVTVNSFCSREWPPSTVSAPASGYHQQFLLPRVVTISSFYYHEWDPRRPRGNLHMRVCTQGCRDEICTCEM